MTGKYYFFMDETGDHGLSFVDPNFPIFLLCRVLFEESELMKLKEKVKQFKNSFFKTNSTILHSKEIRKCDGDFQILFDINIKKKFYEDLNQILSQSNFTIIGSGVDKDKHIKKYGKGAKDPYNLSLSFVIERLVFCLDTKDADCSVDINIERRGKKEDQQLLDQYNTILDRGTYFVQPERVKTKINKFEFMYKRDNIIGLQIADLCAYPLARHVLFPNEPYVTFDVIKSKIYCDKKGNTDGYGLKIFP
ncbi:MAG: hypothetical protein UU09_C0018G0002 [Microgenomates group bacterium GW2011_GWA2_40_6]|nr:MAG: hypothetical protein UU09_C0018G0002 [Microgenomates group bacterium GW2011_GWA2_40_6]HCC29094.1 DUF3800 domain-containing protein [Marinilabiliales bacterium]